VLGQDRLIVRRLEVPDLHAIHRIIGDCRREHLSEPTTDASPAGPDRYLFETFRSRRSAYFVALLDAQVIGGAGISRLTDCEGAICELRKMYLRRSFRGLGVGRLLLEQCLDAARELAYESCYAEASSTMETAVRLYARRGFKRLPHRLGRTDQPHSDTWLLLKLPKRQEAL
jgi:putative acetyltransferase